MELFFNKVAKHFENGLPFALYKKPNDAIISGYFQKDDALYLVKDFTEKGFVFAPFDGGEIVLIPENKSEIETTDCNFGIVEKKVILRTEENDLAQIDFEKRVQKAILAIKNKQFEKLVLSRTENATLENFDLVNLFQQLVLNYPTAFCYCFFHPKVGLWLGGFSEQLIKIEGATFHTMAVAGTQPFVENQTVFWENKEIDEQQFVTNYITEKLKKYTSDVTVSVPYTMKAGNVIHLKTDIQGHVNQTATLRDVITVLHPTPAVCGLPKAEAKAFIVENEGYDRAYYSGFLGELNLANQTNLFVNLRCMRIAGNQVQIYVGCGITKDSIPQKEWKETVAKSMTIKNNFQVK